MNIALHSICVLDQNAARTSVVVAWLREICGSSTRISVTRDPKIALQDFSENDPSVIIIAADTESLTDALSVLGSLRESDLQAPVVLIGEAKLDLDREAIMAGASEYLANEDLALPTLEKALRLATTRHTLENRVRARFSFDKLITKLAMKFINRTPEEIDEQIENSLGMLGGHITASRAFIFLRRPDDSVTEQFEWCGAGISPMRHSRGPLDMRALKEVAEALLSQGSIVVDNLQFAPIPSALLRSIMEESNVQGLALFPLLCRGELLGAVGFSTAEPRARWDGESLRLLKIAADILASAIQQRKMHRELSASEHRYRSVVEGLGEGILLCDRNDIILQVNGRFLDLTGFSAQELLGSPVDRALLPSSEGHLLRARTAKRLEGVPENYEISLQRKDGSRFWAQINATPIYDEQGTIVATLGAVTDVSSQKLASEALRASEAKYRDLVETSSDLIWSVDLQGKITFVNSACRAMYGHEPSELIGRSFTDLVDPTIKDKDLELFKGILAGQEMFQAETRHLRVDGSAISLSVNAIPLRSANHEIIGATGTASDISQRRKAEDELRSQQEFLRQVIDLDPSFILVKDSNFRFTLVNQAFAAQYGKSPEEIVGTTDLDIHPVRHEAETFIEECRTILRTKEPLVSEERAITHPLTGETRWHYTIRKPLILPDGRPPQVLTVATDITSRRRAESEALRLEKQLLQAQKMEAIGQLAAGVAHDLNNALGAVVGHLQLLQLSEDLSGTIANSLEIALGGCERALSLIEQLLGFSRQGKYNLEHHSLKDLVSDTVAFLSKVIEKDIEILFKTDASDYMVRVDAGQVQQALTNLIINAKQAMPRGGTISFAFSRAHIESPLPFNPKASPGNYVVLSVSDTGPGIDPDIIHKIFEPFFTTKQAARGVSHNGGTGLGLAMVYGIMQGHGGWVDVDPAYQDGASFRIYLPLVNKEDAMTESLDQQHDKKLASSSGMILVIDDEPILVDLTRKFLEIASISSIGFTSGEEGVEWYRKNFSQVDLVILDMKMAKMDGPTCFRVLKQINPSVKVAILSGYVQDEAAQELLANGALRFFQKPLKYPELVRWVTSQLSTATS